MDIHEIVYTYHLDTDTFPNLPPYLNLWEEILTVETERNYRVLSVKLHLDGGDEGRGPVAVVTYHDDPEVLARTAQRELVTEFWHDNVALGDLPPTNDELDELERGLALFVGGVRQLQEEQDAWAAMRKDYLPMP